MDNLARLSPLGSSSGAPKTFSTAKVRLDEKLFLGLVKLTARGLAAVGFSKIGDIVGAPVTGEPGEVVVGKVTAAWMSPEEWLFIGDEADIETVRSKLAAACNGETALIWSLTDARTAIKITGEGASEALSSLSPLDFTPDRFGVNRCVRTIFGESGVFIQLIDDVPTYRIIIDQSYGPYAWRMLEDACRNLG